MSVFRKVSGVGRESVRDRRPYCVNDLLSIVPGLEDERTVDLMRRRRPSCFSERRNAFKPIVLTAIDSTILPADLE